MLEWRGREGVCGGGGRGGLNKWHTSICSRTTERAVKCHDKNLGTTAHASDQATLIYLVLSGFSKVNHQLRS